MVLNREQQIFFLLWLDPINAFIVVTRILPEIFSFIDGNTSNAFIDTIVLPKLHSKISYKATYNPSAGSSKEMVDFAIVLNVNQMFQPFFNSYNYTEYITK